MTRILEGGRKVRKNWTSVWSVLTSEQLLLYKEEVARLIVCVVVVGLVGIMSVGRTTVGE